MKLPNAKVATVDAARIRDYLLSPSHPVGRFKAAFFVGLGYDASNWQRLETDLLRIARSGDAIAGSPSPYGQKYEVRGTLTGPSGRSAELATVWIVLTGTEAPQFVTAFPG